MRREFSVTILCGRCQTPRCNKGIGRARCRWNVKGWPALYLIDRKGAIRYTHAGEGEYDTTERTIVKLLAEAR